MADSEARASSRPKAKQYPKAMNTFSAYADIDRKNWAANEIRRIGTARVGRSEYLHYLSGKRITRGDAIKAKCYDCMGYYVNGAADCEITDCPLYPWMPYRRGGSETDDDDEPDSE